MYMNIRYFLNISCNKVEKIFHLGGLKIGYGLLTALRDRTLLYFVYIVLWPHGLSLSYVLFSILKYYGTFLSSVALG